MDCIFCKISQGKISTEKIFENENFFSIYDVNQEVKGHSLIISKNHFENFIDLPSDIGRDLVECVRQTSKILIDKFDCNGFNVVSNNNPSAGQVVNHFHVHVLPRKDGDGLKVIG